MATDPLIALRLPDEPIGLDLDRAIYIGLLLNEVLTNVRKHAFPSRQGGDVHVTLRLTDGDLELTVSDSGRGLPGALALEHARTLGFRIVGGVARRLNARVRVENHAGARFIFTFPREAEAPVEPQQG